ncbi:Type III restriction enzyme, res subunit [Microbulbifer aggregans]|uniref:Type III restriction enzyme, res subunit n=1 Tax=Microbulbifer aggregans TaxID=1769779 RepID=A0A1C9W4R0_9GAMM|nr:DEAD/DEAH box helicase family protein [Microbulbifer aggregans]AOS96144.1 Type III restriction enzyme, res subunit [Microbulbifer aggregans]
MARASKKIKRSFHQELVLNRWLMQFFQGGNLGALKLRLGDDRHEGIDEDGQSLFFQELTRNLFEVDLISETELRRYDLNIVGHWQAITALRNKREGHELRMKYFQYLSLLFTEIYLDWYFNKRQALLDGLNEQMARYCEEAGAEPFRDFVADDLNKIAFWNATGSGKTLLLHVNIKQYLHYFQAGHRDHYPDKIILLTPNEGLSRQHLEELHLSGMGFAQPFNKAQTPPRGTIEIIDINKLGEEMGEKTVAVDAFEGNNLVLVDEGHRGTGKAAGAWMSRRDALVRGGFAFEYSATFGQAVAKGLTVEGAETDIKKKRAKMLFGTSNLRKLDEDQLAELALSSEDRRQARISATREIYAKCILFDYSYKFFYEDGYGKESLILNMDGEAYEQADNAGKYFTACLLSFYQQLWLWSTHQEKLSDYNIEKPLWVFVGNTVAGEESDILEVVNFLAFFLNQDARVKSWLADLIADKAQILDAKGNNIFKGRFTPLMGFADKLDDLYADILKRLFNANSRQRLKLVNLKGSKGELALRVGTSEPFGLINIGDDAKFFKSTEDAEGFDSEPDDDFSGALFGTLNDKETTLNVLIGSRKFTEGWSSWRVSTMGLLNMGQGEGSQIIQLFGRGVRLKGKGFSLKRTLPQDRPKGVHLDKLESLNIFGVRASYMAAFKDYLKEEGITPSDEVLELDFPTKANLPAGQLKTLALKDGYKDNQKLGFKRAHFPWLYEIPAEFENKIKLPHVVLDLYPRVEALSSQGKATTVPTEARHKGKLNKGLFPLFDWDRVYLTVQNYKLQRSWSNLRLNRQKLVDFCAGASDWYTLYIPEAELTVTAFDNVRKQEDILIRLLLDYTDRFYKSLKTGYEGQFYDVIRMDDDHGSMLKLYQFEIENTDDGLEYQKKLEVLKKLVADGMIGEASKWNAPHMVAISFDRHLYYPLLSLEDKDAVPLKLRPLAFDAPSEWEFVRDLEAFYNSAPGKEAVGSRSLYLLRNAAREDKGLGFALAGNFYPDFLLWLVDDESGEQWLTFVDPKGLRNLDLSHPKLGLYKEVKTVEATLEKQAKAGEPKLVLNAFVLSPTKFADLLNVSDPAKKAELEDRHVLFMEDGGENYLSKMFARIG